MRQGRFMVVGCCLVLIAGCGGNSSSGKSAHAVTPQGKHVKLSTPTSTAAGERAVKLKVITTKGRNTLAVAPVFIGGKGPFPFLIDSGASQTTVDATLALKLGLRKTGDHGALQGVGGGTKGENIQIADWKVGRVKLAPDTVVAAKLAPRGRGPAGLLGSDVLSRFGKVAIDYDHDRLLLDPKVKPSK